ncbi:hypothetical protein [Streptomyces sp. V4I2]|uniref:hypothetical protein n=1 Tax=Streptomyces sp. V4I2 TaxID=3042280 RepID=UPI00278A53B1|nr:hypothetical protein [Streptomyces sp. V4I2]MDQ1052023.1 hypothetical protein [Streptomyces sp. V4I2]
MSDTAEQATDEEKKKFDPKDFPKDLREAQRLAAELYAQLRSYQETLPWSRVPHPGWPDETERGRERPGRPETAGWTDEQAATYDRLFDDLREATAAVQGHGWWKRCEQEGVTGADLVALRQSLKHAEGAVPLAQEDVEAVA